MLFEMHREPDFVIGKPEAPYMLRWFVVRIKFLFNIYRHRILRDDDDRALHDHPWLSVSFILRGSYKEITPQGERIFKQGAVIFRRPKFRHRLVVVEGPVETLFITGPVVRIWGFWCPQGFVKWYDFVAPHDKGQVGKGCAS